MKVKICGITSAEDAFMCEELGADALGFVHVSGRARSLQPGEIRDICGSLGPMVTTVLVCAPPDTGSALELIDRSRARVVQLYTLEGKSLDAIRATGVRVIRAVRPDPEEADVFADHADALLFESGKPGTGTGFDYSSVPVSRCRRAIIAGGLTVGNLEEAKRMNPYALDVSSGVESTPGSKDRALVSEFIRRCRS
ncbi:TPA: phosphoribosylanthranilate isomerase [Thermoplasmata archaeon]|nr:phosphoribosylanthranilate isomerase [Thermoplasmata archaeon]